MHILFTVSVINLVLITPVPLSSMLGLALLVTWLFPFSVCGTWLCKFCSWKWICSKPLSSSCKVSLFPSSLSPFLLPAPPPSFHSVFCQENSLCTSNQPNALCLKSKLFLLFSYRIPGLACSKMVVLKVTNK